jgi:hypothetical protein
MFLINKLHKDVFEIENFINHKEQFYIFNEINKTKFGDWHEEDNNYNPFWKGKNFTIGEEKTNFIYNRIKSLFVSNDSIDPLHVIQRYRKGEFIGLHKDNYGNHSNIKYGILLYYNDDYEGGEIVYPEIKLQIKPKAKSLLIHNADLLHKTNPVISDKVRYFSTTFVCGTEKNPAILIDNFNTEIK